MIVPAGAKPPALYAHRDGTPYATQSRHGKD
jgi:hypothetical protein